MTGSFDILVGTAADSLFVSAFRAAAANPKRPDDSTRLLRLAERYKIKRDSNLQNYIGRELEEEWVDQAGSFTGKGWSDFIEREGDVLRNMRSQVADIAQDVGLTVSEFRTIENFQSLCVL